MEGSVETAEKSYTTISQASSSGVVAYLVLEPDGEEAVECLARDVCCDCGSRASEEEEEGAHGR